MNDTLNLNQQEFGKELLLFRSPSGFRLSGRNFPADQKDHGKDKKSNEPKSYELKEGQLSRNEILVLVLVSKISATKSESLEFSGRTRGIGIFSLIKQLRKKTRNKPERAFSGIIIKKGSQVTNFQVGDEIFGFTEFQNSASGSNLIIKDLEKIFHKPLGLTFEDAVNILLQLRTKYLIQV